MQLPNDGPSTLPLLPLNIRDAILTLQGIVTAPTLLQAYDILINVFITTLNAHRGSLWVRDLNDRHSLVLNGNPEIHMPIEAFGLPEKWERQPPIREAILCHYGEHTSIESTRLQVLNASFSLASWSQVLFLPLRDHHNRLNAVLMLCDNTAPDRRQFTNNETLIAGLLGSIAGITLEQLSLQATVTSIRRKVKQCSHFRDVLKAILLESMRFFQADRADLAFWDWERKEFGWIESNAEAQLTDWRPFSQRHQNLMSKQPDRSVRSGIIWRVWQQGNASSNPIYDVLDDPDYLQYDSTIRSELALRIDRDPEDVGTVSDTSHESTYGRRIAVINLESVNIGAFDDQDKTFLQLIINRAADDFTLIGENLRFKDSLHDLAVLKDPKAIATGILDGIRKVYGFNAGLIYFPNYERRHLEIFASLGVPPEVLSAASSFYPIDESDPQWEMSFAYHIFRRTEADWIEDPSEPLESWRVCQRNLKLFGIEGPLLGLRLTHRDEPIGAMVLWTTKDTANKPPQKYHTRLLRPFASLATIALHAQLTSQRRWTLQQRVQEILSSLECSVELLDHLDLILSAARAIGFDRVRLFRVISDERMTGLRAAGMEDTAFGKDPLTYIGSSHPEDGSHYSAYVAHLFRMAFHKDRSKGFVYEGPRSKSGTDPHYHTFGKRPETPWLGMPLLSSGKVYGELAVDNIHTGRRFTDEDKQYLTVLGALAAGAFAVEEKRGMLSASSISTLYSQALLEPDESELITCLLRFLRHDNGGLGFSHVLLFRYDESASQLVFIDGMGQLTKTNYRATQKETRDITLTNMLATHYASLRSDIAVFDAPLKKSLAGCVIRPDEQIFQEFARTYQPFRVLRPFPDRLPDIAAEWVAVRLPDFERSQLRGIFIVSRAWQGQDVAEADEKVLVTFAEASRRLLELQRLHIKNKEVQVLADLGVKTQGYRHEMRTSIATLDQMMPFLSEVAARVEPKDATRARLIIRTVRRLRRRLEDLDLIAGGSREPFAEVSVVDFADRFNREILGEARERGVDAVVQNIGRARTFRVKQGLLGLCLEKLVENAVQSIERFGKLRTIYVSFEESDRGEVIRIVDSGAGFPKEILGKVGYGIAITSRPSEGLGQGLFLVRRIIEAEHGGSLDFRNGIECGACVTITVPRGRGEGQDAHSDIG